MSKTLAILLFSLIILGACSHAEEAKKEKTDTLSCNYIDSIAKIYAEDFNLNNYQSIDSFYNADLEIIDYCKYFNQVDAHPTFSKVKFTYHVIPKNKFYPKDSFRTNTDYYTYYFEKITKLQPAQLVKMNEFDFDGQFNDFYTNKIYQKEKNHKLTKCIVDRQKDLFKKYYNKDYYILYDAEDITCFLIIELDDKGHEFSYRILNPEMIPIPSFVNI